jgi:hypothetical protein
MKSLTNGVLVVIKTIVKIVTDCQGGDSWDQSVITGVWPHFSQIVRWCVCVCVITFILHTLYERK